MIFYTLPPPGTTSFWCTFTLLTAGKNGRTVYRSKSERFFLYYEDWGSNQGSNWMISADFSQSKALVTSPNVEHMASFCVDRLGELTVGNRHGWIFLHKNFNVQNMKILAQMLAFERMNDIK